MSSINIKEVTFKYYSRNENALSNINISIRPQKITSILGSSGSGKSTLLKLINRTIDSDRGDIFINGRNISKANPQEVNEIRRDIGMVYQQFNLVESDTVLKNVLNGRLGYISKIRGLISKFNDNDYLIAKEALSKVGMEKYADYYANNLSGGQKQRVAIARALAQKPKIILADEPVSSLDPKLMIEIMNLLEKICRDEGITLLISLHYLSLARRYSDEIIGIREGNIIFHKPTKSINDKDLIDVYGETEEWKLYGELGF